MSEHTTESAQRERDAWWCRECVLWHPKDMGASPAEAHGEWERRVITPTPCACGSPETYSLDPAEVVVHAPDGCTIERVTSPEESDR